MPKLISRLLEGSMNEFDLYIALNKGNGLLENDGGLGHVFQQKTRTPLVSEAFNIIDADPEKEIQGSITLKCMKSLLDLALYFKHSGKLSKSHQHKHQICLALIAFFERKEATLLASGKRTGATTSIMPSVNIKVKPILSAQPILTPPTKTPIEHLLEHMQAICWSRDNLVRKKRLQKKYFIEEIKKLSLTHLKHLANYMQTVQLGETSDSYFDTIRRERNSFRYGQLGNTNSWIEIRHAVKMQLLSLLRDKPLPLTPQEYTTYHHLLAQHSGRFFSRWGKTATLKLFTEEHEARQGRRKT